MDSRELYETHVATLTPTDAIVSRTSSGKKVALPPHHSEISKLLETLESQLCAIGEKSSCESLQEFASSLAHTANNISQKLDIYGQDLVIEMPQMLRILKLVVPDTQTYNIAEPIPFESVKQVVSRSLFCISPNTFLELSSTQHSNLLTELVNNLLLFEKSPAGLEILDSLLYYSSHFPEIWMSILVSFWSTIQRLPSRLLEQTLHDCNLRAFVVYDRKLAVLPQCIFNLFSNIVNSLKISLEFPVIEMPPESVENIFQVCRQLLELYCEEEDSNPLEKEIWNRLQDGHMQTEERIRWTSVFVSIFFRKMEMVLTTLRSFLLTDGDWVYRKHLAHQIGCCCTQSALTEFKSPPRDDEETRKILQFAIRTLCSTLQSDGSARVRREAMLSLSAMAGDEEVPQHIVLEKTVDKDSGVRILAFRFLSTHAMFLELSDANKVVILKRALVGSPGEIKVGKALLSSWCLSTSHPEKPLRLCGVMEGTCQHLDIFLSVLVSISPEITPRIIHRLQR